MNEKPIPMRLARQDEIAERMQEAIVDAWSKDLTNGEVATAALSAMLDAVVELGVGREGRIVADREDWWGGTSHPGHSFSKPALILQLEEPTT